MKNKEVIKSKYVYPVLFVIFGILLSTTTPVFATFQSVATQFFASIGLKNNTLWVSATAPYISNGFGYGTASAVLANANGTGAFEISTSGVTPPASGVITLPQATTGWSCVTFTETTSASAVVTKQIASTASSVTLDNFNASGAESSFPTSAVIHASCFAY